MQNFTLQTEFTDVAAEREVIAAVAENPELYRELQDLFPDGAFSEEADALQAVADAIRCGQPPPKFEGWTAASDPKGSAQHLNDLFLRRVVARGLEETARHL